MFITSCIYLSLVTDIKEETILQDIKYEANASLITTYIVIFLQCSILPPHNYVLPVAKVRFIWVM